MNNHPLKIALINHIWDLIVQRFHHWERQASARDHDFHIYTTSSPFFESLRHPSRYRKPNIHRVPRSILAGFWARLGYRTLTTDQRIRRFEKFIQKKLMDQDAQAFDVVIYSSIPMANFQRGDYKGILIYDCLDEWCGFADCPPEIVEWERNIASQADLILAVSQPLATRLAAEHGSERVMLVPNGCDYDFFAGHAKAKPKESDRITIGYTGAIHEWFNWEAIYAIADAFPEALVQLIGPVAHQPEKLPANVRLEGRQPYENVPLFNRGYDVCLIPFRNITDTPLIDSVSPIKLYEYLACGKPVVSTPMPDTVKFAEKGVVHLANTPAEFVTEVREALALTANPALISRRETIARQNSWQHRWMQIEKRIGEMIKA